MQNRKFGTAIVNLAQLQDFCFSIPTYQRPYVWKDEQIIKLLGDFYKSYKLNPTDEYFVGTILTKESGQLAELIDGQQRFTTLWLTAFVFSQKNKNSVLAKFLRNNDGSLKIGFEIRTEVEDFLISLLKMEHIPEHKPMIAESVAQFPYLKNIAKALATINGVIDGIESEDLNGFGEFIYQKIRFIKNSTPQKIDLNKLFSTINSAGVQLEQTDIVKANLLKLIDEKVVYGKVWESCENMNNFFERNVRNSFPNTDWTKNDLSDFIAFDTDIFKYHVESPMEITADAKCFSIDFVKTYKIDEYKEKPKQYENEERRSQDVYCRSIINFGQLLLHTYRLHLNSEGLPDFEGTFHVNRLIEIFKSLANRKDVAEIKRFFLLLWKVRYLFDKYVVKWVSDVDTKTEHLELMNVNKNADSYYARSKFEKSKSVMLQSVLYYTGDYLRQYWLTPYLGYLLENHNHLNGNAAQLLTSLENIDNQLSLCKKLTDKVASYQLLNADLAIDFDFVTYLNGIEGTKFNHYWFQKLEYILWKELSYLNTNEFNLFRITSKNSIEHMYPQHPENPLKNPKIENSYLHSFGNLVLLSVSQNSEYSNKSVDEKRSMFKNKSDTYDTLKSYYIFNDYTEWTIVEIIQHKEKMIDLIKNHYQNYS
ncbi:DUF262 domain-containing protein [Pedobacter sp.]